MIVDAHQHLWRIGQNGHEWPGPDLAVIHRDFEVADLEEVGREYGIDAAVLVQSQPNDADTDWMLEVAAEAPLVAGVVGWCDFAAPEAPKRIAALAGRPKLRGLRPMLQGLTDDNWILRDEVKAALAAMIEHGLTFDALIFPRHLPVISRLADAWPELAIVVDHGAKPAIVDTLDKAWAGGISNLAVRQNVCCKLSGLLTEMQPGQSRADMTAYADHLYAVFGPYRLMWGSDWPVVNLRAAYCDWFDWTQAWLADKQAAARDAILGLTAARFYSLN